MNLLTLNPRWILSELLIALERMELIIPARSGLNPIIAVLPGKAARVLLVCIRQLVLSGSLLVPTSRRETGRYLRVPIRQLQQWI